MKQQISTLSSAIQQQISTLSSAIQQQISTLSRAIQQQISTLSRAIQQQISTLSRAIQQQISTLSSAIKRLVHNIPTSTRVSERRVKYSGATGRSGVLYFWCKIYASANFKLKLRYSNTRLARECFTPLSSNRVQSDKETNTQ